MFGINHSKSQKQHIDLSLGVSAIDNSILCHYGSSKGLEHLRYSLMQNYIGLFDDAEILITNGAIGGIESIIRVEIKSNDAVFIPEYYFPPYLHLLNRSNANVIKYKFAVKNDGRLGIDIANFEQLIRQHNPKLVFLNFPNNPTGAILNKSDAIAVASILQNKNIRYISDEVYSLFDYTGLNTSITNFYQNGYVVSSISKSHAAAGIRIGWVITKNDIMRDLFLYHSIAVGSVNILSQRLATKLIKKAVNNDILKQCCHLAVNMLSQHHIDYIHPDAGFFVCIKCNDAESIYRRLLQKGIIVSKGNDFGLSNYIRVSFAVPFHIIEKSFDLIIKTIMADGRL